MAQRIPQQQQNQKGIPICQVCKLQCVPQSAQPFYFIFSEVVLIFISIKLSLIAIFIGFSFCRTQWKCPVCTREQDINKNGIGTSQQVSQANKNLILRMGKCMTIISLNKFRIFSSIICSLILYWYLSQQKVIQPQKHITKVWDNIAKDCGYQAILQNSFRANQYLDKYSGQSQQWNLEGVYLQTIKQVKSESSLKIKMDPTQFSDLTTQDIVIVIKTNKIEQKLQKTDIIQFKGYFEGRQKQAFQFIATTLNKTNKKKPLQQIRTLVKNSLRKNQ